MKKLFLTLCVALFSVGAFAQEKGDMAVGATLNYNFDAESLGFGARYQYFFLDNIRGDVQVDVYPKSGVTLIDAIASAHYLIPVADQISVFPLAGLGFAAATSDGHTVSDFIGQVGGGAQYFFTEKIGATAEAKYQFGNGGAFVLSAGILYKF